MKMTAENCGTVLVVADDQSVLILLQNILATANYRVLLATERAAAIRLARQKNIRIDLVLLDVGVPGANDRELADEIAVIRPDVRMLWMTGFVEDEFIRVKLLGGNTAFRSQTPMGLDFLVAVERAIGGVTGQPPLAHIATQHVFTAGASASFC